MRVVAFIGESGSGKSYLSQRIAAKNGLDCIIDDGLFIRGMTVLAGTSAKKEPTKLASVRHALFQNPAYQEEVRAAIREANPVGILVLATSSGMANSIRKALCLPEYEKIITIEEVATPEQIATARHFRDDEGCHVVPVPTFELRKSFSGTILDSMREWISDFGGKKQPTEKTVVRPAFSYMGDFTISDAVLCALCRRAAEKTPGVLSVLHCAVPQSGALYVELMVDIETAVKAVASQAAKNVLQSVEEHTGMGISEITCVVRNVAGQTDFHKNEK